jgi:hypothetical protein
MPMSGSSARSSMESGDLLDVVPGAEFGYGGWIGSPLQEDDDYGLIA